MSQWIKCEDQDWLNLDLMCHVYVEVFNEDSEYKVMAATVDGDSYVIAGYPSTDDAYARMDELICRLKKL